MGPERCMHAVVAASLQALQRTPTTRNEGTGLTARNATRVRRIRTAHGAHVHTRARSSSPLHLHVVHSHSIPSVCFSPRCAGHPTCCGLEASEARSHADTTDSTPTREAKESGWEIPRIAGDAHAPCA